MNELVRASAHVPTIGDWTPRQLATMQQTVARDTNPAEFDLFIEFARAKGLDPFSRQVIAVVYNKDDPKKRSMTIIVTQDGLRVLAAKCGDYHPAKPGDTEYLLTEYEAERQRLLLEAAKIFELGKRKARLQEIHTNMPPDPTNPSGIVKCTTILWKAGQPVAGEAFWTEFAPLRPDPQCFTYVDTGETWPNGNPKKRRVRKDGVDLAANMILDDSGQWAKMPHIMICKCATMQALRAGWPSVFSNVKAEEEVEREKILDLTATELVEMEMTERRQRAVHMTADEVPFVDDAGDLSFVPAGQFADHVIKTARACKNRDEFASMKLRNREGLRRFWANFKADALDLNAELEKIEKGMSDMASHDTARRERD